MPLDQHSAEIGVTFSKTPALWMQHQLKFLPLNEAHVNKEYGLSLILVARLRAGEIEWTLKTYQRSPGYQRPGSCMTGASTTHHCHLRIRAC